MFLRFAFWQTVQNSEYPQKSTITMFSVFPLEHLRKNSSQRASQEENVCGWQGIFLQFFLWKISLWLAVAHEHSFLLFEDDNKF